MPHRFPLRSLALAVALLAALPAGAHGSTGGAAAADGSAASGAQVGGAGVGAVAPALRSVRGRRRHAHVGGADARRHPRSRPPRVPVTSAAGPPALATLLPDGSAAPPPGAPAQVAAAIAAGNRIASLPYRWGGGHASWEDSGYDCSGSVGYALHGGGLLDASATSADLMGYGERGPGAWITIYANPDHVYMVIAGLRFDTSGAAPSRWQAAPRSAAGFAVRHPAGL